MENFILLYAPSAELGENMNESNSQKHKDNKGETSLDTCVATGKSGPADERLDRAITRGQDFILSRQAPDGYWIDELEANATITAELIFFMRFMGMVDLVKQKKCVEYLFRHQQPDGGWSLYYGGPGNISTAIEAYMALKMAGISPNLPAMAKARDFILSHGGVRAARVFTKVFLAMFGQSSWDDVPAVPVEFILFPNWFYANVYEISSWSRSVVIPLSVVYAYRPVHRLEEGFGVRELFAEQDKDLSLPYSPRGLCWGNFFIAVDKFIKFIGKSSWKPFRHMALEKAKRWILDHQEDQGDWGGIQPAMFNSVLALKYMGYGNDHPVIVKGLEAIERFIIDKGDHLVLQSCISPLWDTSISCNALLDSGIAEDHPALVKAAEWMLKKQVVKPGDWKVKNPHAEPGGWAFEFYNELYPDNDDTAEILMALDAIQIPDVRWKLTESQRALTWLLSMQSKNGGWGAFDMDNDNWILNEVPFADHKALLDPPTVDVTGRILWLLGILGYDKTHPQAARAICFIKENQEPDGCWFGRWGVNYIYGCFLVLNGLRSIGEDMNQYFVRNAVDWLKSCQNADGGWGETCETYEKPELRGKGNSTASQTAWGVLALLACGDAKSPAARRGIEYLLERQIEAGGWWEPEFTATGFPVHFFIKYHMYQHFFPLMALARYRSAVRDGIDEPRKARKRK